MDFLLFTLTGHLRNIKLKLTRKKLHIQGSCTMCGKCCQRINLQNGFTWLKSVKKLRTLRQKDPRYRWFKIESRTKDGLLTFSCRKMINGLCTAYEDRFNFCKSYPEPQVFLMGAIFQKECGYSLVEAPSFNQEFKKHTLKKKSLTAITYNEYGDIIIPKNKP